MASGASAGSILLNGKYVGCCHPDLLLALGEATSKGLTITDDFSDLDYMLNFDSIWQAPSIVDT